jgi:hypothetical protein
MERVIEENTNKKFEKLSEVKSNYETMLKLLKPTSEEQKVKIEAIKRKRDEALEAVKADMAALKKQ